MTDLRTGVRVVECRLPLRASDRQVQRNRRAGVGVLVGAVQHPQAHRYSYRAIGHFAILGEAKFAVRRDMNFPVVASHDRVQQRTRGSRERHNTITVVLWRHSTAEQDGPIQAVVAVIDGPYERVHKSLLAVESQPRSSVLLLHALVRILIRIAAAA